MDVNVVKIITYKKDRNGMETVVDVWGFGFADLIQNPVLGRVLMDAKRKLREGKLTKISVERGGKIMTKKIKKCWQCGEQKEMGENALICSDCMMAVMSKPAPQSGVQAEGV